LTQKKFSRTLKWHRGIVSRSREEKMLASPPVFLSPQMAKEAPKPAPTKVSTKISSDLLRKAKVLAAYEGRDLFVVLDELLRPAVQDRYAQIVRKQD
jgi:hypothetical protein